MRTLKLYRNGLYVFNIFFTNDYIMLLLLLLLILFIIIALILCNQSTKKIIFGGSEKELEIDYNNYNRLLNVFYKKYPRSKLYGLKFYDRQTQYIRRGFVRNNNFIGYRIGLINDLINMEKDEVYLEGPFSILTVNNITLFGEIHDKSTIFDPDVPYKNRSKFVKKHFLSIIDIFEKNKNKVNIFMESSDIRMHNTNSRMEYLEEVLEGVKYFKMDIRNRDGTNYTDEADNKFDYNKLIKCLFTSKICNYNNKYDRLIYLIKKAYKASSLYKNKNLPIVLAETYNEFSKYIEIYDKITIFSTMSDIYTILNLFTKKNIKHKKTWIYAGAAHTYFIYLFLSLYFKLPYKPYSSKYKTYTIKGSV